MPTTLTICITPPHFVSGDGRTLLYNSIIRALDALDTDWNHKITYTHGGKLLIRFEQSARYNQQHG